MELCEEQKAIVFLFTLIVIGIVAFTGGFFDLPALVANLIGDGVMAYLVYLLLKARATNVEKAKMIEAKKYFRKWFYFFQRKWSGYKELIESRSIGKPEIEQPNTIADQLKFSFEDVQTVGFKFNLQLKQEIQKIISDLDKFGFDLRRTMPRIREHTLAVVMPEIRDAQGDSTIKDFIREGEAIVKAIKKASEDVEKSLEIK